MLEFDGGVLRVDRNDGALVLRVGPLHCLVVLLLVRDGLDVLLPPVALHYESYCRNKRENQQAERHKYRKEEVPVGRKKDVSAFGVDPKQGVRRLGKERSRGGALAVDRHDRDDGLLFRVARVAKHVDAWVVKGEHEVLNSAVLENARQLAELPVVEVVVCVQQRVFQVNWVRRVAKIFKQNCRAYRRADYWVRDVSLPRRRS